MGHASRHPHALADRRHISRGDVASDPQFLRFFAAALSRAESSCSVLRTAAAFSPREQKRTERHFIDLFPDAVDTVARMVRAGLPITAAVRTVAVESSPPVSEVFAAIADQVRIGVPIEKILDESSTRIGLPDFRFFVVAVGLQYATGGNLTQTLEILSDVIRKRRAMRLKAKAASGEILYNGLYAHRSADHKHRRTAFYSTGLPLCLCG